MGTAWLPAALLGAATLAAMPAAALEDLTGGWAGTVVCDFTSDTHSTRTTSATYLQLDDDGPGGNPFAYLNNVGPFRLTIVSGPDAPQRGRIAGPSCAFDPLTGGWLLQAVVKAKPGSDKASLKGELITLGIGGNSHYVQVCRLKLKRTSLTIGVPITDCP